MEKLSKYKYGILLANSDTDLWPALIIEGLTEPY
jgi:hypothetical protein